MNLKQIQSFTVYVDSYKVKRFFCCMNTQSAVCVAAGQAAKQLMYILKEIYKKLNVAILSFQHTEYSSILR